MGFSNPEYVNTRFGGTDTGPGKVFRMIFLSGIAATFVGMVFAGVLFWYFSRDLPKIISVEDYKPEVVTRVYGNNGKEDALIGEFFKIRRYVIPYDKIPDIVVKAFISAEDDRFFEHPGINLLSMIRAGIANFKAGHVVQGGSTITQQVAKSILNNRAKSFDRKIKEVILSTRMERNLTKQQILYLYLNEIYLGHGAYGVQAAAQVYFHKDISQVNVAEAAILAGMPQAPGIYSPLMNPKKAKERQLYVLRRLYENKYISQAVMNDAGQMPLKIFHEEDLNKKFAPHYIEQVRRYVVSKYGDKAVNEEGLVIHVPTSPELAKSATDSLREGLLTVDKRIGFRGPIEHLKSTEEIEKFLREERLDLIERKLHHQILTPDGRIDPVEAMHFAGARVDGDLLEVGDRFEAVVTGFDAKRKSAHLMIGAAKVELLPEGVRWARPMRDEKNPNAPRPDPGQPSRFLTRGDVVWVKVTSKDKEKSEVMVALDQEPEVQGAIFSMEAQTGSVLAMEGGYDFATSEFNRAMQAQRQPGSSFKPIIYSAALEKGYTLASVIVDSPIIAEAGDGLGKWKPGNFEEKFYGDTTFRQALIKSRNIPTIKLVQALQVHRVIEYAKRLGMSAQFPSDLSISLGSGSTSLVEMTKTYALFPRLGRQVRPTYITRVYDRDGKLLEENQPQLLPPVIKIPPVDAALASPTPGASPGMGMMTERAKPLSNDIGGRMNLVLPNYPPADDVDQVLDPRVAYVMTHLMKEVVSFGTGHDAKALGRVSAGKTGTTNDYIDAWFMGFTPHVVTGVWVGYDSQKSLGQGETGARAALPIWLSFMKEAVKPFPDVDFTVPQGVVFASINMNSGKLAPPNSSTSIKEAFIEGTEPKAGQQQETSTVVDSQSEFFKEDSE